MADKGGYIGRNPGDSAVTISRQTNEPTGVQTSFNFLSQYTPGLLDVYVNGVRQIDITDYSATDGSTISLTSAANIGDVLEFVAYKAFNVGNIVSTSGNFTVGNNLTVNGFISAGSSVTAASFHGDGSGLTNVGMDTSVINSNTIDTGSINITGLTTTTNQIEIRSTDATPGRVDLYCEVSNAHYARIQAPPHAEYSGNVVSILPKISGDLIAGDTSSPIDQSVNTTGIITAASFVGSGANLTNLNIPAGFSELDAALFN